ncbi:MAG TPA: S8 family serine peptidase [Pyrinomonadaceae bacterium]|nr:S8 family serine peptidase [Pyrinomonadaceae bacterium]
MFRKSVPTRLRQVTAVAVATLLCALPAVAGIRISPTQGLTQTGADGIYYDGVAGLTATGADGLLAFNVNGIHDTSTSGLTQTGADGLTQTGADGVAYTGANSYTAQHVDGLTQTGADGLTVTGADGLTVTGADGTTWQANSVVFRQAQGLTVTGADGLTITGADGLTQTGADSVTMAGADGMTALGVQSIHVDSAGQVVLTKTDGTVVSAPTNGLTVTGADGLTQTGADGVTMQGVNGLTQTGADGLGVTLPGEAVSQTGLMSFDPELALALDRMTDDSSVNAVVVYHDAVNDSDIADLQSIGLTGGTRYRALPMVAITATKSQIFKISALPRVRTVYGTRTLQWNDDNSRTQTGLAATQQDSDLRRFDPSGVVQGTGIVAALIDTGVDATHPDLAGRVIRNVKLADLQGAGLVGFNAPTNIESLPDTDQASGHGTFVSGIIAGSGASSTGRYAGYAPRAQIVGLSAGDYSLLNVVAGFDYLLSHPEIGVRVVNCSFSANTVFDPNDPVNVATRMLVENGVNVVFSAGNSGPGLDTLNPYAEAPWVISVGALDQQGRLAAFSSRGEFGSRTFRPTLVAPGVNVVSLRASGTNITGTTSLPNDAQQLSPTDLRYYTTASGTSFSAPQVVGTIALMLEVNPNLTPAQVRDILQRTATPLPPYYQHEVGAGALNTHAAVLQSAFPARRFGLFRAVMNRGQVRFVKDPSQTFDGTVYPGSACDVRLSVPANAVFASTSIAWGPFTSPNDLALSTFDPTGRDVADSNYVNVPGLTGKVERTLVDIPAQGVWRARVTDTLAAIATPQTFAGVFETAHVEYAPMPDTSGLDADTVSQIQQAVRALAVWPDADGYFRPAAGATRAELAEAMIAGARVPQYIPASPSFTDVSDATTSDFAEGAQSLFPDAVRGGAFRPDAVVTRLTAAIVLVRAAGLRAEAESQAGATLPYTDTANIPYSQRGYVQVAVSRGLMTSGQQFNPYGTFTRADLARGVAAILRMNTQ